jgi:glycosyltransferase involved in cell wall biosynthesis
MAAIENLPTTASLSTARGQVSILIPVHNGERYLRECLDSVLMQDFPNLEILIADDCSTDYSVEIIQAYAARDARIRWWQNPVNLGLTQNHNVCLRAARGEYIKFVHADDRLLQPSVVTQMVQALEANPAVALVSTGAFIINEQSQVLRLENKFRRTGDWDGKAAIIRCLEANGNIIGEPSRTLFRKAHAGRGFDERYRQLMDLEMWFHLLEQGRLAYLAEPLIAYRVHPNQATKEHHRTGVSADESLMMVTDYYRQPWLAAAATRRMLFAQIYSLRKQYGTRAAQITGDMMSQLGPGGYALGWMRRKVVRPFEKLSRRLFPEASNLSAAIPSFNTDQRRKNCKFAPMKVLMIAEDHGAPPETQIGLLLARAGVVVRFIFREGSVSAKFLREQGMNVQELPIRGRLDLQTWRGIRAAVKEFQPDIIHAFTAKSCWYAILAQWFSKKAKLVYYRGAIRPFSHFSPADLLVFFGRRVDIFECYSQAVQKDLVARGISATRTMVNYYGHKPEWYAGGKVPAQWAEKNARFRIGCVANHRKVKGLEFLVAAADLLAKTDLDFELLFVGKDGKGELAECVARATSRDRIKLTGLISEPWGIMKTFDCLVVPSLQEAMGRVTLEAMACGVPLVVTNVGGLPEVVEDGKNGLVVPSQNPERLAAAIAQMLGDEPLRKRFGENGRQVLREKFDLDQTRDRLLALYQRLTK